MEFLEIHPVNPQPRYITKAVETLKTGGLLIYPTDTLYAIGCDIYNREAIEKLYLVKNESEEKLFSIIINDFKNISTYAKVSDYAFKIMKKNTPGPYTFILPASKDVPKKLWSKRNTVGIRIPDNKTILQLAEEFGSPILSSTVTNRKGEVLLDIEEIKLIFNNRIDLMLSIGALKGMESTIVDLSEDEGKILRVGAGSTDILN